MSQDNTVYVQVLWECTACREHMTTSSTERKDRWQHTPTGVVHRCADENGKKSWKGCVLVVPRNRVGRPPKRVEAGNSSM